MEQQLQAMYSEFISPMFAELESKEVADLLTEYIGRDLVTMTIALAMEGTPQEKEEAVQLGILAILDKLEQAGVITLGDQRDQLLAMLWGMFTGMVKEAKQ